MTGRFYAIGRPKQEGEYSAMLIKDTKGGTYLVFGSMSFNLNPGEGRFNEFMERVSENKKRYMLLDTPDVILRRGQMLYFYFREMPSVQDIQSAVGNLSLIIFSSPVPTNGKLRPRLVSATSSSTQ